jgi:hypothetical protein
MHPVRAHVVDRQIGKQLHLLAGQRGAERVTGRQTL